MRLALFLRALALLLTLVPVVPTSLAAQAGHEGHAGHGAEPAADPGAEPGESPYADLLDRPVKALSEEDVRGLREGEGMGMALPAELNGWPGPRHVLEMADALELTADQRRAVEVVRAEMTAGARALGARVIEAETALDALFASGDPDADAVREAAAEVGRLRGALRAVHLVAHLATTEILTDDQVAAYARLRGYASGSAAPDDPGASDGPAASAAEDGSARPAVPST